MINTNKTKVKDLPPETETNGSSDINEDKLPTLLEKGELLDMQSEQEKDKTLKKLYGDIKYTRIEQILYYIAEEPTPGLKLVISKHLKDLVLKACHDDVGHLGIDKTYDRVKTHYHWEGVYRDIVHYVSNCVPCGTRHLQQRRAPYKKWMRSMSLCKNWPWILVGHILIPTWATNI